MIPGRAEIMPRFRDPAAAVSAGYVLWARDEDSRARLRDRFGFLLA